MRERQIHQIGDRKALPRICADARGYELQPFPKPSTRKWRVQGPRKERESMEVGQSEDAAWKFKMGNVSSVSVFPAALPVKG
jgi:hypothetical protein